MAQILFGSIRDEHFPENRAPLAPIVVPIDAVTPKPTLKTVGWADDDDDFDFSAGSELAAPMKTQKPDFTFAQIAKMR
jgi:phosphorylated adapter RNA export protein